MTDRIISGLLKNGGELHIDVVTTTVTCKSNMRDAAVVDGAAAAKAAAAKVTYHRDNILAANPVVALTAANGPQRAGALAR